MMHCHSSIRHVSEECLNCLYMYVCEHETRTSFGDQPLETFSAALAFWEHFSRNRQIQSTQKNKHGKSSYSSNLSSFEISAVVSIYDYI